MSNCVFKSNPAVEIRLPINIQQADVFFPSALREPLAKVGRHAGHIRLVGKNHVTRLRIWPSLLHHGTQDFTGGVVNQGVPEIAGNGLVALAAFAGDGVFHGDSDAVRGFVKEHLQGIRSLVTRLRAGDSYAQRVESRECAGRGGEGANFDANLCFRPGGLVNVS